MKTDICIIGSGAAGLMAGIVAAQNGAKVALVDSNSNPGRKLLKTGGGRCNITHEQSIDEFLRDCEPYSRFLRHSSYEFSPEAVCEFFKEKGIGLVTEPNGCVFPITNRANDVVRVLVDTARRSGAEFVQNCTIDSIEKNGSEFLLRGCGKEIQASKIIIATGGKSLSMTGSKGDGYKFAASLGHTINQPRACLVQLISSDQWMHELGGVALKKVNVLFKADGKKSEFLGAMIFTSNGIGGPVVLNVSRAILNDLEDAPVEIVLDLLTDFDENMLRDEILKRISTNPKRELASIFADLLPRSLAISFCQQATQKRNMIANQLDKSSRNKLVDLLKRLPVTITKTRGIEEATITRGGVCVDEIGNKTMQSKLVDGLFFAGEVIDVDGPCGGYNLQIAWSTGALAGRCAAEI